MTIQRRKQYTAGLSNLIIRHTPHLEEVGRITVSGIPTWQYYKPGHATGIPTIPDAQGNTTVDNSLGYSIITADLGIIGDIGEGAFVEMIYTVGTVVYWAAVYFDLVRHPWQSEVDFEDMEDLVPHIRYRLTKQGSARTVVLTAAQMAARHISTAQDHFFLWLHQYVLANGHASYVALVPDNAMFDSIVTKLAMFFTYDADVQAVGDPCDVKAKAYYQLARGEFELMRLVSYDTNFDGQPDSNVLSSQEPRPVFEEMQGR